MPDQYKKELFDNKSLTFAVIENLGSHIMIINQEMNIITINKSARNLLYASPNIQPVHHLIRAPNFLQECQLILHSVHREQSYINVLIHGKVQKNLNIHIQKIIHNTQQFLMVTLQTTEDTFNQEKRKRDFISYASHELKTPLTALSGFVNILQGPAGNDLKLRHKFLGIISKQLTRLQRLTDNLMSLHRIEMQEHVPPQDVIDVVPVIHDVCSVLLPFAQKKNITFNIQIPVQLHIRGSYDELTQVFLNLVENAVKYSPNNTKVEIIGKKSTVHLEIDVIDEGEGIAEQHLPRITERFYRIVDSKNYNQSGTGLGLSIVKHIVNRHSGRLEIRNRPEGSGAIFSVILPVTVTKI